MMKYKCVIFDCDGVLVDSEDICNSILVEMAESIGVPLDKSSAAEIFTGKSTKFCFDYIETIGNKKLPITFAEDFKNNTYRAFKKDLQPIKGVHEVIKQLDLPFCVASSGSPENIRLNLTTTKLIENFEGKIFSCHDINSWKPEPGIFLYAAKEMGFKPEECVVIEDSIPGVEAAISGGFKVLALSNSRDNEIFIKKGASLINEVKDLFDILNF